jgi:hypothetical protein
MSYAAKRLGTETELRVIDELQGVDWHTETSAALDYAAKADVRTVCPGRRQFLLQVSAGPKSVGETARLDARGVVALSAVALDAAGMTTPEYICTNTCTRQLCEAAQTPIPPLASSE